MSKTIPTGRYVIINNKPYAISAWNGVDVFRYANSIVWYDELRDGPVVTEAEVKERYPEWML